MKGSGWIKGGAIALDAQDWDRVYGTYADVERFGIEVNFNTRTIGTVVDNLETLVSLPTGIFVVDIDGQMSIDEYRELLRDKYPCPEGQGGA